MISFASQFAEDSKAYPGVRYTVRRLNQIQRAKRDAALIDARVRFSELNAQSEDLPKDEKESAPDKLARATLDHRMGVLVNQEFKPAYIRAGLLSVDGMEIDGKSPTADVLIESGPTELIDEIYLACELGAGLTADQQKNSQAPSTSPEAELEGKMPTTA